MRTRIVIAAALLAIAAALVLAARPHETTADERVDRITTELRCPVCQGAADFGAGRRCARGDVGRGDGRKGGTVASGRRSGCSAPSWTIYSRGWTGGDDGGRS